MQPISPWLEGDVHHVFRVENITCISFDPAGVRRQIKEMNSNDGIFSNLQNGR